MKNLFYRLILFLDTADEKDTNYMIAWFMANNFYRVSQMGISELAKECFVSPATISRFCRALGYENFAHLKQECLSFHSNEKKLVNLTVPLKMMKEDPSSATHHYLDQIIQGMKELEASLDWEVIDDVLREIHDTETVAFFGTQFSQSAALHLQTDLLMLEKFSIAYLEIDRQMECARNLDENSLAIITSVKGGYEDMGQKVIQYIKKSKAKIVLITQNKDIALAQDADYVILLGNYLDNPKIGKHSLLTVVELMSSRYYSLFYSLTDEWL